MYFQKFPLDYYSLNDRKSIEIVTSIYRRVVIPDEVKNNLSSYEDYVVKEGETPENLAYIFYGDSQYHWIILHTNNIIDPRFDWPLTNYQLEKYVASKYGESNLQNIHHYENAQGRWVMQNYPFATAITNFAYEDQLNEQKRFIKILKPVYVVDLIQEFENKIKL